LAVYKRCYRPYQGPLTSERWRFLVVPRYALQELVESRNLMAFVVMCLFPFLAEAVGIYVANFPPARALLRISGGPDTMRPEFFAGALALQGSLAIILAAWVTPVLVSPDLVNGALPLYLSRPFSRAEYLLGKALALFALLSVVTWVPVLVLFALQAGLAENGWLFTHLRVVWATLLGSWIWIAVLALLGLSLSAWIRWRLVASTTVFGVFFMGEYANIVIGACLTTILFLGGWDCPFGLFPGVWWFLLKIYALIFTFIWIRWTFPRTTIYNLLNLSWKVLIPISLFNLLLTAGLLKVF
jgi:hypothetical protein